MGDVIKLRNDFQSFTEEVSKHATYSDAESAIIITLNKDGGIGYAEFNLDAGTALLLLELSKRRILESESGDYE